MRHTSFLLEYEHGMFQYRERSSSFKVIRINFKTFFKATLFTRWSIVFAVAETFHVISELKPVTERINRVTCNALGLVTAT